MGKETATAVVILAVILVVLIMLAVRYVRVTQRERPMVPDYRVFIVIGLAFIPIAVVSGNLALVPVGVVFALVGLANGQSSGRHTR
jgi:heme/copper-type cytochrome/quinol oxidase subunit 2